jgi:hypothetical protein
MPTGYGTGTPVSSGAYDLYTLGWIREQVARESGRFDLVQDAENDDYSDNGFDRFINDAQDWLDRKLQYPKGQRTYFQQLSAGQSLVVFQRPRYIEEVWCIDDNSERYRLERKTYWQLREDYNKVPLSSADRDEPAYWAPAPVGLAPEQANKGKFNISNVVLSGTDPVKIKTAEPNTFVSNDTVSFANVGGTVELNGNSYTSTRVDEDEFTLNGTDSSAFTAYTSGGDCTNITEGWTDTDFLDFGRHFPNQGLIVMPPSSASRTMMVLGDWYSVRLVNDDDRSVWTYHPSTLIAATRGQMELRLHRQSASTELFLSFALAELQELYFDLLAEEAGGPPELAMTEI